MPEARAGVSEGAWAGPSTTARRPLRDLPWTGEYTADTACSSNDRSIQARQQLWPAEVAAPMRKLWLLKFRPMRLEADSAR